MSNKRPSRAKAGVYLVLLLVSCSAIGYYLGYTVSRDTHRESAVEARIGEFYIDENNNKAFRFIKNLNPDGTDQLPKNPTSP